MIVTIEVTQEDINKGCKALAKRCPIARAINRVLKNEFEIAIAQATFGISSKKYFTEKSYAGKTPSGLSLFMSDFDSGKEVKPFSFEIDIPTEFLNYEKQGSS